MIPPSRQQLRGSHAAAAIPGGRQNCAQEASCGRSCPAAGPPPPSSHCPTPTQVQEHNGDRPPCQGAGAPALVLLRPVTHCHRVGPHPGRRHGGPTAQHMHASSERARARMGALHEWDPLHAPVHAQTPERLPCPSPIVPGVRAVCCGHADFNQARAAAAQGVLHGGRRRLGGQASCWRSRSRSRSCSPPHLTACTCRPYASGVHAHTARHHLRSTSRPQGMMAIVCLSVLLSGLATWLAARGGKAWSPKANPAMHVRRSIWGGAACP